MFDRDQERHIRQALRVRDTCPNCGKSGDWWRLQPEHYLLPVTQEALEPGHVLPLIAICCESCGCTLHFNASILGLSEFFSYPGDLIT
jgi:hypothetical protein